MTASISRYYLEYRYLAILDGNGLFAAATGLIEGALAAHVKRSGYLTAFLEEPLLRKPLPAAAPLPSNYAKVFPNSGIVRIRRGGVSATVYGGTDWPLGVASGLASNPAFFTFRKGGAVLESVRMGCNFFSEGVFRSEGVKAEGGGYVLHQRFDVPYYQPLAGKRAQPAGRLSPDSRGGRPLLEQVEFSAAPSQQRAEHRSEDHYQGEGRSFRTAV